MKDNPQHLVQFKESLLLDFFMLNMSRDIRGPLSVELQSELCFFLNRWIKLSIVLLVSPCKINISMLFLDIGD